MTNLPRPPTAPSRRPEGYGATDEHRGGLRAAAGADSPVRGFTLRRLLARAMAWSDEDLKVCVERLAAPAERQLAWVRNLGSFPSLDELALDFDDEFRRVQGSAEVVAGRVLLKRCPRWTGSCRA